MNAPLSIKTRMKPGWERWRGHLSGASPEPWRGRIPRVTKLLALAHRFEWLLKEGVVKDYAKLARLGQVTRARITQIMNLLNLSPEILNLSPILRGDDTITEHQIRDVISTLDWTTQRTRYRPALVSNLESP